MEYDERLSVPLRWWVQATMLVASLGLAVLVATPPMAAGIITLIAAAIAAGCLLSYGSARIHVDTDELRAGRAHIPLQYVGTATALDRDESRRLAGPGADARAYLVLRPYLKRSVRVAITDERDPAPYWQLSTRHPDRLVAALDKVADQIRH